MKTLRFEESTKIEKDINAECLELLDFNSHTLYSKAFLFGINLYSLVRDKLRVQNCTLQNWGSASVFYDLIIIKLLPLFFLDKRVNIFSPIRIIDSLSIHLPRIQSIFLKLFSWRVGTWFYKIYMAEITRGYSWIKVYRWISVYYFYASKQLLR